MEDKYQLILAMLVETNIFHRPTKVIHGSILIKSLRFKMFNFFKVDNSNGKKVCIQ